MSAGKRCSPDEKCRVGHIGDYLLLLLLLIVFDGGVACDAGLDAGGLAVHVRLLSEGGPAGRRRGAVRLHGVVGGVRWRLLVELHLGEGRWGSQSAGEGCDGEMRRGGGVSMGDALCGVDG